MNTEQFGLLIPIPAHIRQDTHKVGERGLAVWVVSRYLDRYNYQSDYTQSSAWNLALQALTELADLEIKEDNKSLGVVECIPIAADADTLEIPEQAVMDDRIAYIAVELNAEQTWGTVIGFTPALEIEYPELSIAREDLLPTDKLLDLLDIATIAEESLFSELKSYWPSSDDWFPEQRQGIIAQLERALLLESAEPLQIESAAQEIEALISQSTGEAQRELAVKSREDAENQDRAKLRQILGRLFQSLRAALE
ncbi:MAG TPA: DUF1822 family protein [Oscillatoriaceae cyanobacterium M33_DOE_052]|uniref:DUF1822 family protein n=1 Tax=Planktothricoides sp. SpSt-374 TaxID=2282167 RepID=A0A7C3ZIK4_9CYAN|nr:DUF1822 family protein [Oscillatoriaceae cyanobacterium M33_DOE_052]